MKAYRILPIVLGLLLVVALGAPHVFAATQNIKITPNVTIPGSSFVAGQPVAITGASIGEWVSAVYAFLSGTMGIIAAMMILWGGIKWITATGNTSRVQEAKDTIYSALIALVITFGAYLLLRTINPQLVQIRDLSDLIKPITRIEQLSEAALPKRVSEALFGNQPLTNDKNLFNSQNCPTEAEMRTGFEVFLTGYYRPAWPAIADIWKPSGGYQNFPCNVAMQCSCEHDVTRLNQCQAGGLTWTPCDMEKLDPELYCTHTASTGMPVDLFGGQPPYTAAASSCFGFGTRFKLARPGSADKVFTTTWAVSDRGSDITGRHLDLYTGTGADARTTALNLTGHATMTVSRYCRTPDDCTDYTP